MERPVLIRPSELVEWLGISRSMLYALVRKGDFPQPLRLGSRFTAWRRSDVEKWLEAQVSDNSLTSDE